jgi:hypothetical protein
VEKNKLVQKSTPFDEVCFLDFLPIEQSSTQGRMAHNPFFFGGLGFGGNGFSLRLGCDEGKDENGAGRYFRD